MDTSSLIRTPYIFNPVSLKVKTLTVQFKNRLTLKRHDQKLSEAFPKIFMVLLTEAMSLKMTLKSIIKFFLLLFAQMRFKTDAFKPACDWLTISQSQSDWLRAFSS